MANQKLNLEVGDIVVETYMGKKVRELRICRVTNTQAIANHFTKFRRRIFSNVVEPVGGNMRISTRYKLKTNENE